MGEERKRRLIVTITQLVWIDSDAFQAIFNKQGSFNVGNLSSLIPCSNNYETEDCRDYELNQYKTLGGSAPLEPEAKLRLWVSLWTTKRGQEMSGAKQARC